MLPTRSQFQDLRQSGELWARQHGIQGSSILNWGRSRFVVHHLIRCLKYVELGSTSRFFFWPRFLARKLLCMCMCMWYHRMWCMWKWIGALLCQGIDIRFIIILRKAFLEIFFWVFTDVSLKDTFWNILTGAARTLLIPSGAITHREWSSGSLKLIWCWGKTERAGGVWRWIKEAQIYTLICICLQPPLYLFANQPRLRKKTHCPEFCQQVRCVTARCVRCKMRRDVYAFHISVVLTWSKHEYTVQCSSCTLLNCVSEVLHRINSMYSTWVHSAECMMQCKEAGSSRERVAASFVVPSDWSVLNPPSYFGVLPGTLQYFW